jgi:serine/threonine protein kinase
MLELKEKTLAHYTIQRRLALGGMSQVFLANDELNQRSVAIKVVNCSEEEYVVRFQREVKTLCALKHPHILPVLEYGEHGSWYYCVMPYIEHGTLRERLNTHAFTQEEAGAILEQIASALQFAHEQGILHRDIKPSNILLKDEKHVYLADFGLAKDISESTSLTQTGCLIGTPEYMAPELSEGPADTSSDIYAVGILLYQMLTGCLPFKGNSPMSTYLKHIQEQPRPPSQLNPDIAYPVEQVILRAIEKDPEQRYPTVQALAEAYAQALVATRYIQTQQEETGQILQNLKLSPPTQRIIELPTQRALSSIHPTFGILVAAMFLCLIPFSLGFLAFNHDAPTTMGASVQLPNATYALHEKPPIARPTEQPAQPSAAQLNSNQSNRDGHNTHRSSHRHRHKHGHGDD